MKLFYSHLIFILLTNKIIEIFWNIVKIYFNNIDKCSSFTLNNYFFVLFVVDILFFNNIIKLKSLLN
jgi:hypothetical protein